MVQYPKFKEFLSKTFYGFKLYLSKTKIKHSLFVHNQNENRANFVQDWLDLGHFNADKNYFFLNVQAHLFFIVDQIMIVNHWF